MALEGALGDRMGMRPGETQAPSVLLDPLVVALQMRSWVTTRLQPYDMP